MKRVDPVAELGVFVRQRGSVRAAAAALGVTDQYVRDMLKGNRRISGTMLTKLGLQATTTITRMKGRAS